MPWKYRKLISNIGNVFQALVGRNGDWRPLVTDAEAEAPGARRGRNSIYQRGGRDVAARAAASP